MTSIKTNIDNFYLWFGNQPGREKITFGGSEIGIHYTIIFKGNKRSIDFHKTIEHPEGTKKYEQILEIRMFTFIRFWIAYQKICNYLLSKFWFTTRINIGKLKHHNLVLIPLKVDDCRAELFIDNKRKRKIRFRKEIPSETIFDMIVNPNEVPSNIQNSFWVYSTKKGKLKQQGIIFKPYNDNRIKSFYFLPNRQLEKWIRANTIEIFNILNRLDFKNKDYIMTYLQKQLSN